MYPAYLWGIETQYGRKDADRRPPSIQPTYEELKPHRDATDSAIASRIQPTYEELKPGVAGRRYVDGQEYPAYLWGIETHLPAELNLIFLSVSSLPMRNWNFLLM